VRRLGKTSVPTRPADITGRVTARYATAEPLVFLVVANGGSQAAYVEVDQSTPVLRRGQRHVAAQRADLRIGALVAAWYAGPIRETNPPVATAQVVVILEEVADARESRRRAADDRLVTHEDPGTP
jgi:hypothetical protein